MSRVREERAAAGALEIGGAIDERPLLALRDLRDDPVVGAAKRRSAVAAGDEAVVDQPLRRVVVIESSGCRQVEHGEPPLAPERREVLEHGPVLLGRHLKRRPAESTGEKHDAARCGLPQIAVKPGPRLAGNSTPKPLAHRGILLPPHVVPSEVEGHDVGTEPGQVALEPFQAVERGIADHPGVYDFERSGRSLVQHRLQDLRIGSCRAEGAGITEADYTPDAGRLGIANLGAANAERIDLYPDVRKRRRTAVVEREHRVVLEEATDLVSAEVAVTNLVFDSLERDDPEENLAGGESDEEPEGDEESPLAEGRRGDAAHRTRGCGRARAGRREAAARLSAQ